MPSGAEIPRPTIPPNWRRWPPATDGTHYSTACPYQTRVSRSRIVLHMALVQQKSAPAAAAIDGENALLIQPIAMHHVANRDHLITFPGRHIPSEEPAAESVQQLVFLRFLTGLGIGGVMANAVALASEYSPQRQRASLLMWISCGFTGGAIAGGVISAALIPWGGWRSVFLVGGVLPLAIAAMMYWRLPESLLFLSLQQGAHDKLAQLLRRVAPGVDPGRDLQLARPEQVRGRGSLTKLFRDGRALMTLLLWLVSFANLLNLFFLANWLPLLSTRMGFSPSTAVLMGSNLPPGGLIGAVFLGPLIDRLG